LTGALTLMKVALGIAALALLLAASAFWIAHPAQAGYTTRGIFRFDSLDWPRMAADGFNTSTDYGPNFPNGMVWIPAYDRATCAQKVSDADLRATVLRHPRALTYQLGDEPASYGCAAHDAYVRMTAVVHAADSTARTWVADDQFQIHNNVPGHNPQSPTIPMAGSVDILAFPVYPCQNNTCDWAAVRWAASRIPQLIGTQQWQVVVQDFQEADWSWPSVADLQLQMDLWAPALTSARPPTGYWVFAWDYGGDELVDQPGHEAFWQDYNRRALLLSEVEPSAAGPPAGPVSNQEIRAPDL
jgi:hypothetical protein